MEEDLYGDLRTPTPPNIGAIAGESNPAQVANFARELEEDHDLDPRGSTPM